MNIKLDCRVSGKINWLEVRDKAGNLKARLENIPNLITTGFLPNARLYSAIGWIYAMTSNAENYEDMPGTWNQSGNIITRATGAGTFPVSPDQIGNELYWSDAGSNTGHRCHVTARQSDTSISVSGSSTVITGGTLRRFFVNGAAMNNSGYKQATQTLLETENSYNDTTGIWKRTIQVNFGGSPIAYSLGSFITNISRIKLPDPIAIDVLDEIQFEYTATETVTGRSQVYELGAESIGIPQKYNLVSIVGSGSYVDVTFDSDTLFLAGDKLDLRPVTPKRFGVVSATSNSTSFTVNTALAHGFVAGNSITIEGASVGGYNGTFTIATATGTSFTVTNSSNPGTMGAGATARLATPGGYFNSLGLAVIASMPSASVARITSTVTGPAVDLIQIGGDPGTTVKIRRNNDSAMWYLGLSEGYAYAFPDGNQKALLDITTIGNDFDTTNSAFQFDSAPSTNAGPENDWTNSYTLIKNSGTGTDAARVKQLVFWPYWGDSVTYQITFNTPFNKTVLQSLRVTVSKQITRDLPTTVSM